MLEHIHTVIRLTRQAINDIAVLSRRVDGVNFRASDTHTPVKMGVQKTHFKSIYFPLFGCIFTG